MIKSKIFFYELKRTILSKSFAFLLLIVVAYSIFLLRTKVMYGVFDTAPFSEWTFISFLLALLPLLFTILLVFTSRLFSPNELSVKKLTASAPFSGHTYFLIRLMIIMTAYILAAASSIAVCFAYYSALFDVNDFLPFLFCILLVLLSQMLFITGAGVILCKINPNFAFFAIAVVFILSFSGTVLPYYADFMGSSILNGLPDAIPINGYIPFDVPSEFVLSRIVFGIVGLILLWLGSMHYQSRDS